MLASSLDLPLAARALGRWTRKPRLAERRVGGVPTTVALPDTPGGAPALVFLNGATPLGRYHPAVRRLAQGIARAGIATYVPDVHGLVRGEITERTVADGVAVSRAAADEAAAGETALAGISVGATLALLVAAEPGLGSRVRIVGAVAPYADLVEVIRLATTGRYRSDSVLEAYETDPFLGLVVARSLLAGLPEGEVRDTVLRRLRAVPSTDPEPLACLRDVDSHSAPAEVARVVELLRNRDPERFEDLHGQLPEHIRRRIDWLSPLRRASAIDAPVELASGPRDKYFPLAESRSLVAALPRARLTVTPLLDHAGPAISRLQPIGAARFYRFLERTLAAAGGADSSAILRA